MPETVLVTGGNGFVGSWCVAELLKRGYDVRTTVRNEAKEQSLRAALAAHEEDLLKAGSPSINADRLTVIHADLTKNDGWSEATVGCDYILHVASPLGVSKLEPEALINTAREGTTRVLQAAVFAGVKRVVVTSSVAACSPPPQSVDCASDETKWTTTSDKGVNAYQQSKTLAERAAWQFGTANPGLEIVTVLPAAILGPLLVTDSLGSVQIIQYLLNGKFPGYPRLGFNVIDVRDLADLHIRAMTAQGAAGQRFIAAGEFWWMGEMAKLLRDRLGEAGHKAPRWQLPDFVLRFFALFDAEVRNVTGMLGRKHTFTATKARTKLGWKPRAAETTILDCANSLIENKLA